jgi:hypothetical protein
MCRWIHLLQLAPRDQKRRTGRSEVAMLRWSAIAARALAFMYSVRVRTLRD